MKEYIKALEAIEFPRITTEQDLQVWQGRAIVILIRMFGKDSIQEEQVRNVKFQRYTSVSINGVTAGGGNNSKRCEEQASQVVRAIIDDVLVFGIPGLPAVKLGSSDRSNNSKQVFIVHGHDDIAKTKTARFIQQLGLEPIILHEQASGSKTVIEKIEAFTEVGFGIVLYTPCDTGGKIDTVVKYQNRARQNVVFEHGFLIGKIGRKNVCALVKGDVETPNDISGVVYVKMDEDDAWQMKVFKELKNSGYDVDANNFLK